MMSKVYRSSKITCKLCEGQGNEKATYLKSHKVGAKFVNVRSSWQQIKKLTSMVCVRSLHCSNLFSTSFDIRELKPFALVQRSWNHFWQSNRTSYTKIVIGNSLTLTNIALNDSNMLVVIMLYLLEGACNCVHLSTQLIQGTLLHQVWPHKECKTRHGTLVDCTAWLFEYSIVPTPSSWS